MVDPEHLEGALELCSGIPGTGTGEYAHPVQIPPLRDLVHVAHMDADSHLDGKGPEGLHRLALHLLPEAFEAVDIVCQLIERDVRAVVPLEFTDRVALDGHDRTRGRLNREVVVRNRLVEHLHQVGDRPVAGGTHPRRPPADLLGLGVDRDTRGDARQETCQEHPCDRFLDHRYSLLCSVFVIPRSIHPAQRAPDASGETESGGNRQSKERMPHRSVSQTLRL